ncbi:MAG: ABC transporter permease subunit, partial [Rhodospirillales bacterium]|nr:ABC transporter permease subunit [Rhodospirillales bacterium]
METAARSPAASRLGRGSPGGRVWLLLLPAVGFLLFFYGYPVVRLLALSVFDPEFTLKNYQAALTGPVYVAVLKTTLKISLQTTVMCLLMGYPLAYLLATTSERKRNLLIIAVVLPYFTSILVRSYAWLVILGRHGILNEAMISAGLIDQPVKMIYNTTGVVVGMAHIMLPIMVLALYAVMRGINMDFLKVSESLGANQVQTFLRVYFPLSLPGIGAGCLLVFIFSVGFYITPALLGGLRDTMLSMLIATQIQELLRWGFAGALSLILLVVTLCIFLAFNRVMGLDRIWGGHVIRDQDSSGDRPAFFSLAPLRRLRTSVGLVLFEALETVILTTTRVVGFPFRLFTTLINRLFGERSRHPGKLAPRRWGIVFVSTLILAFLLVPIALLFPVSFTNSLFLQFPPSGFSLQWYRELVDTTYWTSAFWLSLRVAPASMVLAVVLGTLSAIALARGRFRLKDTAFMFILSPIIVPVIVTAVA